MRAAGKFQPQNPGQSPMIRTVCRACIALAAIGLAAAARGAPPAYDHIVIVLEENRSEGNIIGSPDAPYINSLAAGGASFTNFYAVSHPSQPNYLDLFSGSLQNIFDDTVPAPGAPFTTPNLGAEMESLFPGTGFGGYSEDLPAVGSTVDTSAGYVRKHNPWVNWQGAGANQLDPSVNMPFSSFPGDYSTLPKVSFVVPNQPDDMHDGTIAAGDSWLSANIGPYATWAASHNSLLVVTWDEGSGGSRNNIPTIFYGAHVQTGPVNSTYTTDNLLHTIEGVYGTGHAGSSANVTSIVGAFTSDPAATRATFQQGATEYAATHDTYIDSTDPTTPHGSDTGMVVSGAATRQGLIRFDQLFGGTPGQVPAGATILSAKLRMATTASYSTDTISIYRMLSDWNDSSTWASLGGGINTDNVAALSAADFSLIPNQVGEFGIFDVTASVQAWADGAPNFGWLLQDASGGDGWLAASCEADAADLPLLDITFTTAAVPEPSAALLMSVAAVALLCGTRKGRT